ncbi:MAG: KTSC domain-containing protein [Planctomycetota bacterium]|nr:KTSC domain-containing protein [Planctomycetota bacterium]
MAIKKVDSSMVYAVDYDPKTRVLEVVFKRMGVFAYSGVPQSEYRRLMKSDSIGSHMRYCIIGTYPERKLD